MHNPSVLVCPLLVRQLRVRPVLLRCLGDSQISTKSWSRCERGFHCFFVVSVAKRSPYFDPRQEVADDLLTESRMCCLARAEESTYFSYPIGSSFLKSQRVFSGRAAFSVISFHSDGPILPPSPLARDLLSTILPAQHPSCDCIQDTLLQNLWMPSCA
jgi:hypothetical protein